MAGAAEGIWGFWASFSFCICCCRSSFNCCKVEESKETEEEEEGEELEAVEATERGTEKVEGSKPVEALTLPLRAIRAICVTGTGVCRAETEARVKT